MTRVKRSVNARKKRRATLELAKGYRGEAHSNYKRAKEAVLKADQYRYRDRRNRKRDFRRLWITRINAAARINGMSYSQFMHGLQLANVELDRKILADIAVRDADTFRRFADRAREALAAG
jgi:large subunit ribosomal protein L20